MLLPHLPPDQDEGPSGPPQALTEAALWSSSGGLRLLVLLVLTNGRTEGFRRALDQRAASGPPC